MALRSAKMRYTFAIGMFAAFWMKSALPQTVDDPQISSAKLEKIGANWNWLLTPSKSSSEVEMDEQAAQRRQKIILNSFVEDEKITSKVNSYSMASLSSVPVLPGDLKIVTPPSVAVLMATRETVAVAKNDALVFATSALNDALVRELPQESFQWAAQNADLLSKKREVIEQALKQVAWLKLDNSQPELSERTRALVAVTLQKRSAQELNLFAQKAKNNVDEGSRQLLVIGKAAQSFTKEIGAQVDASAKSIDAVRRFLVDGNKAAATVASISAVAGRSRGLIDEALNGKVSLSTAKTSILLVPDSVLKPKDKAAIATLLEFRQAKLQFGTDSVTTISTTLTAVTTLAQALKIPIPKKAGAAMKAANLAMGAMSAYATGGPVGAAAAIFGGLGGGDSGGATRHAEVMAALDQINLRLDKIEALQQETIKKIDDLSVKIDREFAGLHERLDRIEFEINATGELVRIIYDRAFADCASVRDAGTPDIGLPFKPYLAPGTYTYLSLDRMLAYNQKASYSHMKECWTSLENEFTKLPQVPGGTPFLPLQAQFPNEAAPGSSDGSRFQPGQIQFLFQNYNNTFAKIDGARDGDSWTKILIRTSTPTANIREFDAFGKQIKINDASCAQGLSPHWQNMLCDRRPGIDSETLAREALAAPIMRGHALLLAESALLVGPLRDIGDDVSNMTVSTFKWHKTRSADTPPAGRDLIHRSMWAVNVALAQSNLLSGEFTARCILDSLLNSEGQFTNSPTPAQKSAYALIRANPILAHNVLTWFLYRRANELKTGRTNNGSIYAKGIELMENPNSASPAFLLSQFGEDLQFTNDANSGVALLINTGTVPLAIALPSVREFSQMSFRHSEDTRSMLSMRNVLATRLAEYDAHSTTKAF